MKATISQATSLIELYLKAKLVPMLVGSPGIGKSQAVHALAKKYNLKLIDLRLAQCDPVDLMGFPHIAGGKGSYLPMSTFPIEGDPIPEGYTGWLLFMDEANSAPPAVQVAGYKIFLDRMVGQHKLHPKVLIVAAGNLMTDGAIVQELSTALQSRLVHIELEVNNQEFLDWAATQGFDPRITSYLSLMPGNLHNFKPDHTDHTYACPRTWEFANRILKDVQESSPLFLPALAGTLGEGVAMELVAHCKMYAELPKMSTLLSDPKGIPMPSEPSVLWALTGAISHAANDTNCKALLEFVSRMPIEFQVVTLRAMTRRTPALQKHPAVGSWIAQCSTEIF